VVGSMRRVVVGLVLLAVLIALGIWAGSVQAANQGRWIPGTPYMISEEDATGFLEDVVDHAYCQGIPRFGMQGEFPYEEYVVFDCTISHTGKVHITCSGVRYRSVKGVKRGYFRLKGNIRDKDCF